MKKKRKIFGIILCLNDYRNFYNQNKELIHQLSKDFKEVYVINVINLKLRTKSLSTTNEKLLPKNFKIYNFLNSNSFLDFFKNKKLIALQYLSKNPDFFRIFYLIKLARIKNIMVMNLGNFGNKQTPNFNIKYILAFKHYYEKGFYYLFRILTIFNIFPKIDLLFESNTKVIHALNNGISRKFENLFPFFKISYFRNIQKINSIFFDKNRKQNKNSKQKSILYIDVPLDHGDIVTREGIIDLSVKKKFYKNLSKFLKSISKLFGYKIIIGLHPSSKIGYKYLSNFKISKKRTIDLINSCEVVLCTHSSLISSAVINKKKIVSIESEFLGNYVTNLSKKYKNSLDLYSINIDSPLNITKSELMNGMKKSYKNYNEYIKTRLQADGNLDPYKKISRIIKKNYFN
jgi:hypothetical protein